RWIASANALGEDKQVDHTVVFRRNPDSKMKTFEPMDLALEDVVRNAMRSFERIAHAAGVILQCVVHVFQEETQAAGSEVCIGQLDAGDGMTAARSDSFLDRRSDTGGQVSCARAV